MFKKSIVIVLIQLIGIVLGFLSVFLVAGDMEPEVYSIIGIYQIVCSFIMAFTGWGLEAILLREALYWNTIGEKQKVEEYATQAVMTKVLSCIILMPIVFCYLTLMNIKKYNGHYTSLFVCIFIGSFINILIDSMRNIVNAEGGYVFSQLMTTINATVLKLLGIIIYFSFGVTFYLYFYILSSFPILICFIIKCRKRLSLQHIKIKPMLHKVWEAKYLWLKGDLEYVRSNIDSLLVSLLFPSAIMGSYSIYKSLNQMMNNFIAGFFDVLSQNMVKYKGNEEILCQQEKKFKLARNIFIIGIVLGIVIYVPKKAWWVSIINLSKYPGIELFILCVAIGGILYLLGKSEINAIYFFGETKMIFFMSVINALVAIVSYLIILVSPSVESIVIQRIINYTVASLTAFIMFKKNKTLIYSNINK